jgi:hypothetical protein
VDCNGSLYYQDETAGAYWTSSNTSVVTVSHGLVTAVAAGTAGIRASFTDWVTGAGCLRYHVTYSDTSSSTVMVPKYVVLNSSTNIQGMCIPSPVPGVERDYFAYDANNNRLPMSLNWKLNETVTSASNCNVTTDGTADSVDFPDTIYNCKANCTFESNQTFQVTLPNGQVVSLQGKDCPRCSTHTGWHVKATTTGVTVTDN